MRIAPGESARARAGSRRGGCGWWCPPRGGGRRSAPGCRESGTSRRSRSARRGRSGPPARPRAAFSARTSAPAALLTTSASSAPVRSARAGRGSDRCGCPARRWRGRTRGCCTPRPRRHGIDGGVRERGAPEVGVQHDAGGVERRAGGRRAARRPGARRSRSPSRPAAPARRCARPRAIARTARPRRRHGAQSAEAPRWPARAAAGRPRGARRRGSLTARLRRLTAGRPAASACRGAWSTARRLGRSAGLGAVNPPRTSPARRAVDAPDLHLVRRARASTGRHDPQHELGRRARGRLVSGCGRRCRAGASAVGPPARRSGGRFFRVVVSARVESRATESGTPGTRACRLSSTALGRSDVTSHRRGIGQEAEA